MNDKRTLLICGGTGLLGPYMLKAFEDTWDVVVSSRNSNTYPCDFTDPAAVDALVKQVQPNAVIHLIALTNVDECENNPEQAQTINADTVKTLVQALPPETHLTYISTDQVYSNTDGPHTEGTENPVNVYGSSKLNGEEEALKHSEALTLRVNLFGPSQTQGRQSLDDFFIKSFKNGDAITMFEDVYFSPLHMSTLSQIVSKAVDARLSGAYNLGTRDGMSKADFALKLAKHLGLDPSAAQIGKSAHITGRALRPKDLRMDVGKIEQALGIQMPTLEQEIQKL